MSSSPTAYRHQQINERRSSCRSVGEGIVAPALSKQKDDLELADPLAIPEQHRPRRTTPRR